MNEQPLVHTNALLCPFCGQFLIQLERFESPLFAGRSKCFHCARVWLIRFPAASTAVELPTALGDLVNGRELT